MKTLLRADLRRMFRNPVFYLALLAAAALVLIIYLQNGRWYETKMQQYGAFNGEFYYSADGALRSGTKEAALAEEFIDLGAVCSGFGRYLSGAVSLLFLAREFGGVSVFKLVRGISRTKIFFSAIFVCSFAAALLRVFEFLVFLAVGFFLYPEELKCFLRMSDFFPRGALISVLGVAAFNCFATSVGMCVFRRRTLPVIAAFLIATYLLSFTVSANSLRVRLEAPEMTYFNTADDSEEADGSAPQYIKPIFDSDLELVENPDYVGGAKRVFLTVIYDCFSWTQDYQFSYNGFDAPPRQWTFPLYSAGWILLFSLSGAAVFRRRDLL